MRLGLHHPAHYESTNVYGEDNVFTNDSWQTTAMSYFDQRQNTDLEASWAAPCDAHDRRHHRPARPVRDPDPARRRHRLRRRHQPGRAPWDCSSPISPQASGDVSDGPVTFTLFDSGGIDTINLSTDTDDQHVVLQPETASDVYGLVGNLVIARDTLIENYVAGPAMTSLSVMTADNVLEGGRRGR